MRIRLINIVQWVVLCGLLLLTQLDVEMYWSDAEMYLLQSLPVLICISTILGCFCKRVNGFASIDGLVVGWWALEFVLCYTQQGVFTPVAFIAFSETIFLYLGLRLLFCLKQPDARILLIGLLICAGCESVRGLYQLLDGSSRHGIYPITGNFLNPGPYAAYLAIGLVLAVTVIKLYTGKMRKFAFLIVFLSAMALSGTWSRAAWLSVGISIMCIYHVAVCKYKYVIGSLSIVGCVFIYLIKQGSADGRFVMWISSVHAMKNAPWFGAGIGSFGGAYANGISDFFLIYPDSILLQSADVTNNAYCELLTMMVEQGIIGMLLFVFIIVLCMIRLWRNSKPLMYALLTLLIFSMFSYPFQILPYRILLAMLCAWAAGASSSVSFSDARLGRVIMGLFMIIVCLFLRVFSEARHNAMSEYKQLWNVDATYVLKDYYRLLPMLNDVPHFLFDFGKVLADLERYNDSNAVLAQAIKWNADPMFRIMLGNNYRDMNLADKAESYYLCAFRIMPNRLYPLYRLMKLYEDTGCVFACRAMAHRVVNFKEKITSEAIAQMKREAKSILENE